jgi:predicted ArsR family transcriptional regulator
MSSINFIYLNNTVIREHLAVLRRDDIAQQRGSVRRHGGKPAYVYGLTSEAEDLFPKT